MCCGNYFLSVFFCFKNIVREKLFIVLKLKFLKIIDLFVLCDDILIMGKKCLKI